MTGFAGGRPSPGHGPGTPSERDDRALIQAHLDGDPSAFSELVRRHRDRLWAVAMRTMADRDEAADALQDALISAFRNAGSYRGEAAVTTWLHRVVVNACLDRLRRRKARPSVPLGEFEPALPRDDHAAVEARIMVHDALARLPQPQREAIVLVDLEELSVAEAAVVLGVAEGTVKSRCSRGRTELGRLLRTGNAGGTGSGPASGESLASGRGPGTSSDPGGNPTRSPHVGTPVPRAMGTPGPTRSGGGR